MDAKSVKGLAVVSVGEGIKLGTVDNLLFSTDPLSVAALAVKTDAGRPLVPLADLVSIGEHAVTVESRAAVQSSTASDAAHTFIDLDELGKRKVVDRSGTFLGSIAHVEFEPQNGRVTQITVHKGGMLGLGGTTTPIDATQIAGIGPELITLTAEMAE